MIEIIQPVSTSVLAEFREIEQRAAQLFDALRDNKSRQQFAQWRVDLAEVARLWGHLTAEVEYKTRALMNDYEQTV